MMNSPLYWATLLLVLGLAALAACLLSPFLGLALAQPYLGGLAAFLIIGAILCKAHGSM